MPVLQKGGEVTVLTEAVDVVGLTTPVDVVIVGMTPNGVVAVRSEERRVGKEC